MSNPLPSPQTTIFGWLKKDKEETYEVVEVGRSDSYDLFSFTTLSFFNSGPSASYHPLCYGRNCGLTVGREGNRGLEG